MNKEDLKKLVQKEVSEFKYAVPDESIGNPMPDEKVKAHLLELKASLVEPYREKIELQDTIEQIGAKTPVYSDVWIVADDRKSYKVFYDEKEQIFGLAKYTPDNFPATVNVYGDLVGTFMAR